MAIRPRHLHHRIKGQAANTATVMAGQHPAIPALAAMPVSLVTVNPTGSMYVTLAMQDLAPVVTADGAMVMATAPGRWDQLALAGR